jgi:hypothetical protein
MFYVEIPVEFSSGADPIEIANMDLLASFPIDIRRLSLRT